MALSWNGFFRRVVKINDSSVLVTACLAGFLSGFAANAISGTVALPTFTPSFRPIPKLYSSLMQCSEESPRWLLEKGRDAEAKKALKYLHRTTADPSRPLARAETVQIKAQVETERALPKGFIYVFSTPRLRKRAFIYIVFWAMRQVIGITAVANLITTSMTGLGFGTVVQLDLSIFWSVCAVLGYGIDIVLLDPIGGFGMAAILSTMATLAKYYLCEGSTITYLSFFGNAIAYSAPVSLGLHNIGWRFYMIMGLTLDEIKVTFGDKVELELKDALYNNETVSIKTTGPAKPESAV
ncbi:hypothetical protein DSL72_001735 [Monilinia vaccinii-corymbosi]|uniref:Uncharacterized protein n=1 Tax=Monilinia vaccinii-corymbosi TaxID=61207 RepID=A0A8A3P6E3_9HELO|nr:hypothetical protein DSL72_001735 [Monilinia vaccinii-corymbosi]